METAFQAFLGMEHARSLCSTFRRRALVQAYPSCTSGNRLPTAIRPRFLEPDAMRRRAGRYFSAETAPQTSRISYSSTACAREQSISTSRAVIGRPAASFAPHFAHVRYSRIRRRTGSTCRPSSIRVLCPHSGHTVGMFAGMYRRGRRGSRVATSGSRVATPSPPPTADDDAAMLADGCSGALICFCFLLISAVFFLGFVFF